MKILVSWLLCMLMKHVDSWPEGPPLSACVEMKPGTAVGTGGLEGHTSLPINSQPGKSKIVPYYIQIHDYKDHYLPDTDYHVSIVANQTLSSNHYIGLLLQARKVACAGNTTIKVEDLPIGSFSIPYTGSLLTTMDCEAVSRSAVSHVSRQYKTNETVIWRSPPDIQGPIVFRMTIVQEATVYWTEQNSIIMLDRDGRKPLSCGTNSLSFSTALLLLVTARLFYFLY